MKKKQSVHLAVCKYLKLQYPNVVFFSEPSGLRTTPGVAKMLKGMRSDSKLPDLFIAHPKGGYSGLFIEIKDSPETLYTKDGRVRNSEHLQAQNNMLTRLRDDGYIAEFGPGFEKCKEIIDYYLNL
jgi:hypothetical protein